MDLLNNNKNRRKHTRHSLTYSAFALLRTRDKEVLGSIKDISTGGLCLSHIAEDDTIDENSRISINLISGDTLYEQFSGRSIWSKKEERDFSTSLVEMKRCGIQFGPLSEKMQGQLNRFLDFHIK